MGGCLGPWTSVQFQGALQGGVLDPWTSQKVATEPSNGGWGGLGPWTSQKPGSMGSRGGGWGGYKVTLVLPVILPRMSLHVARITHPARRPKVGGGEGVCAAVMQMLLLLSSAATYQQVGSARAQARSLAAQEGRTVCISAPRQFSTTPYRQLQERECSQGRDEI